MADHEGSCMACEHSDFIQKCLEKTLKLFNVEVIGPDSVSRRPLRTPCGEWILLEQHCREDDGETWLISGEE